MFAKLYGNETLKEDLAHALQANRLAHAYLVEGPPLSGKHTLCKEIAVQIAIQSGGGDFAEKIRNDACADVHCFGLTKDRKTISVELVRQIKESVYLKPVELNCKVYLLEDTEKMTVQAQNALLKLLEEPPKNVYFFLLCDRAAHLLPTVQSRAPILRMELFSKDTLRSLLLAHERKAVELAKKDPQLLEEILTQSEGVYGKAVALLDTRKQTSLLRAEAQMREFFALLAKGDRLSVFDAVALLPQKREEAIEWLGRLQSAVSRLLLRQYSKEQSLFFETQEQQDRFDRVCSKQTLVRLYEGFGACMQALESNANVSLQLTKLLYEIKDSLKG